MLYGDVGVMLQTRCSRTLGLAMEPAKCESEYRPYFRVFERHFWWQHCPKCGAKGRSYTDLIQDTAKFHETWAGKVKNNSFTGKRKLRGWFFSGHQWSTGLGKFVHKSVSADKNIDTYHEKITDIESGEIIHECQESLRDHQGHRAAKFRRKKCEP